MELLKLERPLGSEDVKKVCSDVLQDHPEQVVEYREGKTKLMGFFMKHIMAATKGAINARAAKEELERQMMMLSQSSSGSIGPELE